MRQRNGKDCGFDFIRLVADKALHKIGPRAHRHDFYSFTGRLFHIKRKEAKAILKEMIDRGFVIDGKRGIEFLDNPLDVAPSGK